VAGVDHTEIQGFWISMIYVLSKFVCKNCKKKGIEGSNEPVDESTVSNAFISVARIVDS